MTLLVLHILVLSLAAICMHLTYSFKTDTKPEAIGIIRVFLGVMMLYALNDIVFRFWITGYYYLTWSLPLGLLYGPVLYIGTRQKRHVRFNGKWFIHFFPFLLGVFFYFLLLFSFNYREKYGQLHYQLLYFAMGISFFAYSIWRLKTVKWEGNTIRVNIHLLLLVLSMTIIVPKIGEMLLQVEGYNSMTTYIWYGGQLMILFFLYLMFVKALQTPAAVPAMQTTEEVNSITLESASLSMSAIDEDGNRVESWKAYLPKLIAYMDTYPYLDVDFDLKKMGADLDIPRYMLNELFTDHYKETFMKKINILRIEYACKVLRGDSFDLNIEELWKQCGFRSRASFYRNFSQVMASSPSDYRNKYAIIKQV